MIRSFRHKGLERFWTRSDTSRLRPDWIVRINRLLRLLQAARRPQDLAVPGTDFMRCAATSKAVTP